MAKLEEILAELAQARDELRVQLHLASKDAEDEWDNLTEEWDKFLSRSQFDKSSEEVGEAARQLGMRMKDAYDRMKKAI